MLMPYGPICWEVVGAWMKSSVLKTRHVQVGLAVNASTRLSASGVCTGIAHVCHERHVRPLNLLDMCCPR